MHLPQKLKLSLVLIGLTSVVYFFSLSNPFIWDDEQFIQKNIYVQEFNLTKIFTTNTIAGSGEQSNYYRPFTTLSFALDAKMWGQNPYGFHVTNVLLHIAAGVFLFFLLQELGLGIVAAFFISLIFLIHPVQTEAVTYINSRGDSLYTLFLFAALYLFAKGLQQGKRFGIVRLVAVVSLYISSILSKEIALAGCLLFPIFFLSIRKKGRVISWVTALATSVAIGYFFLRLSVLNFGNTLNFYGENNLYTTHLGIRLFTFAKVLWIYLGILLWPNPLHMERSVTFVTTFFSPWVIGIVGLFIGLIALGIFEVRKKKSSWILIGTIWFFGMLIPSSGIIPINGILYEHWLYVPMVGFCILIYGVYELLSWMIHRKLSRKYLLIPIAGLCIVYGLLTIAQNNLWADPVGFYTYTLSFAPNSARVHNNLGMTLQEKGDNPEAIAEYKKAISLGSNYPQIYYNLGNAYVSEGLYQIAEEEYKQSIRLAPNFLLAKLNLLASYMQTNKYSESIGLFTQLEQYYGNDFRFEYNYGIALWKLGKRSQAKQKFSNALELSGNNDQLIQAISQMEKQ